MQQITFAEQIAEWRRQNVDAKQGPPPIETDITIGLGGAVAIVRNSFLFIVGMNQPLAGM